MKIFSANKLDQVMNDPRFKIVGIARAAGITRQALNSLRKGETAEPGANTLFAVSSALGKPMEFFFEDEAIVKQKRLDFSSKKAAIQ